MFAGQNPEVLADDMISSWVKPGQLTALMVCLSFHQAINVVLCIADQAALLV